MSNMYDREGTARAIRIHYTEKAKQRMSGGGKKYSTNSRHDNPNTWLKAADSCMACEANPMDYVAAAFQYCRGTLWSSCLVGGAAQAWYREYARSRTGNAERAVNLNKSLHNLSPEEVQSVDTIVGDGLSDQIDLAGVLMKQRNELPEHWSYESTLMDDFVSIPAHVRVAIAGRAKMWAVVKRWMPEAKEFLLTHPAHTETLRLMGFDVLKYLNES